MDPDSSSLYLYAIILPVLILTNAFFVMSETAVITMNDAKLRRQAQDKDKRAALLVKLLSEPSHFLSSVQIGITLSGLFASALTASAIAPYAVGWLHVLPLTLQARWVLSLVLITLLLACVIMVFGELVPKRIAVQHSEAIAYAVAPMLALVFALAKPFVALLSAMANFVLRLLGIDPHSAPESVTEEEIRMMIDVGNESGQIEESDKDMINNIFELDDHSVDELMTHRTEIIAVEHTAQLHEIIRVAVESGYSRIPVYKDDLDSIVGILYVKDLLGLIAARDTPFTLREYLREPLYVLESFSGKSLLKELREKKIQMAVVVDEYGGTSGLITMEDLLESIVGNIQDEYDDEEEDIAVLADNLYRVDGLASFDDIRKFFTLSVQEEDEEEYETIGGYIVSLLGYIPADGERPSVTAGDIRFTVEKMEERRIAKLLARRIPPPNGAPEVGGASGG